MSEGPVTTETVPERSHTPGPWIIDPDWGPNETYPDWASVKIGAHTSAAGHIGAANARLIAAAPELLAALKAMDEALCNGFDTTKARHAGRKALIAARAAIAKAEGQS